MSNPVTERKDAAEISKALKFEMAQLPEGTGFLPVTFSTISGKIGQIDYEKSSGAKVSLRMAEGTDDISGVGGVEYEQQKMSDVTVSLGAYGDLEIAWFPLDGYTYALTAEDYDGASLEALTGQFISSLKQKK